MADAEKAYLKSLFSFTRGNVKTACEISGLSRSGMYTRLARYNIHRE
jgi:transcriptional regulator of acetoin/glycerol metabolism